MEWYQNYYLVMHYLLLAMGWVLIYLIVLFLENSDFIFVWFDQDRFLAYTPEQHPIVLQIGGSNLDNLAKATQLANAYGYDEINFKLVLLLNIILVFLLLSHH